MQTQDYSLNCEFFKKEREMRVKAVLLFSLVVLTSLAIADVALSAWESSMSDQMSEQAVEYRTKGYQAQKSGDIATAIKYYQKAIVLDPNYAIPYNDLGVAYEGKGWLDRAERTYLKALEINPDYLDVYSNLALLHEGKDEIDSAIFYWKERVRYGEADSIWTQNAWEKLTQYLSAAEVEQLTVLLAQEYHLQARSLFEKEDFDKALERIDRAVRFMPEDRGIVNLKKKIEVKLNEKSIANKMTAHYNQGMKYYYSGNYVASSEEFKKMLEFLPAEN